MSVQAQLDGTQSCAYTPKCVDDFQGHLLQESAKSAQWLLAHFRVDVSRLVINMFVNRLEILNECYITVPPLGYTLSSPPVRVTEGHPTLCLSQTERSERRWTAGW